MKVKAATKAGRYGDGDGLALMVQQGGRRSRVLRLRVPDALRTGKAGNRRDFGIGPFPDVSLSEARARAASIRAMVRDGVDPRSPAVDPVAAARHAATEEKRLEVERDAAKRLAADCRFETVARRLHAEVSPTFRAPKHAAQWLTRLETYAFPRLEKHGWFIRNSGRP